MCIWTDIYIYVYIYMYKYTYVFVYIKKKGIIKDLIVTILEILNIRFTI
jgi:hypothetical protein